MKIAIIGSGIAGVTAAHLLHPEHQITLFEAADRIGGHTHTHQFEQNGNSYSVDSGFIVFNNRNYPGFTQLLDSIGITPQPTTMSFSVKCENTGLEYNGTSLNTLFAQRRNFFRPAFWRMLKEILRFNRLGLELYQAMDETTTMDEFLREGQFSSSLIDYYVIPMGAALWSSSPQQMRQFPARFYLQFFANHGMLSVNERPEWFVIPGGSCRYMEKLVAPFAQHIRLATPVASIERTPQAVIVRAKGCSPESFDAIFLACHSDQALAILSRPTPLEKQVLASIPYQVNDVIIHTDSSILPKRKAAWAAWNYHIPRQEQARVSVTYNMNMLQNLQSDEPFLVSLNTQHPVNDTKILSTLQYHHPLFTPKGVKNQSCQASLNKGNRSYFCGAYWGFGFHEDGVSSALRAVQHFKQDLAAQ